MLFRTSFGWLLPPLDGYVDGMRVLPLLNSLYKTVMFKDPVKNKTENSIFTFMLPAQHKRLKNSKQREYYSITI